MPSYQVSTNIVLWYPRSHSGGPVLKLMLMDDGQPLEEPARTELAVMQRVRLACTCLTDAIFDVRMLTLAYK